MDELFAEPLATVKHSKWTVYIIESWTPDNYSAAVMNRSLSQTEICRFTKANIPWALEHDRRKLQVTVNDNARHAQQRRKET